MVDTRGQCLSQQDVTYDPAMDYRRAVDMGYALPGGNTSDRGAQSWVFLAESSNYCSADDTVCSKCKNLNFWRGDWTAADSRFCVGQNGCVCVDVCENQNLAPIDCASTTTATPTYYLGEHSVAERLWRGFIGVAMFLLLVLVVIIHRRIIIARANSMREVERRRLEERRQQRRRARSEQLGVRMLSLSGWEKYRKELIDKEQAQLSDGSQLKAVTLGERDEATTGSSTSNMGESDPVEESSMAYYIAIDSSEATSDRASNQTPGRPSPSA